ncbi:glycosyltransferase family 4 protein [Saccharothrix lopnurensis]|uniref:Glycosyltransferase family 4 protein n=1 Tax=Saccharothrix lopnurensis TaxID=1670621 RepID=A0ABW1PC55_9PSEU
MRIATGIDLPLAPSAGSPILCGDVYRALRRTGGAGLRTTFFCLPPVTPDWDHGFTEIVVCESVKQPYGPEFPAYVDALTDEVSRHLARADHDVIHAQHLGFGLSLAFSRAATDLPVVSIAHGTDVISALASAQARAALVEVVERSAAVVVPNTALRDRVDEVTGGRFGDRLDIVPWGIPLHRVARRHVPGANRVLNLLHAGRLVENKSTRTALESLPLTRYPHRLTIAGDGEELPWLRRRTVELGLSDRVDFLPFLTREELWRRFADHDAFVFTTRGIEAFGLVAVEAQAHGLPVVHSEIPGLSRTLGPAAVPFRPGDPAALAAAIDLLADDPAARREASAQGLRNAATFDVARTADRVAEVSRRVLSSARPVAR